MRPRFVRMLAISCVAAVAVACVPSIRFKPTPLAASPSKRGAIAVGSVTSTRKPDRGGESFQFIGRVRGGYGNPFTLEAERGRELNVILREAMTDVLRHTGLDAEAAGVAKPASRLDLEVQDFWCDGYMGYQVTTTMVVRLVDTKSGQPVAQKTISLKDGFGIVVGYGPMQNSFSRVIDKVKQELVAFLQAEGSVAATQK